MSMIFVNLKRFDVPRRLGGVCPFEDSGVWIRDVIEKCIALGLGDTDDFRVTFFLPESLIISAAQKLKDYSKDDSRAIRLGSQGVFREDIRPGGNFGAFTTNLPATAAKNLGCTWTIIGHSEERKDKLGLLEGLIDVCSGKAELIQHKAEVVNEVINQEVLRALESGLNVLLCVGETAEERGEGSFEEQRPRVEAVLRAQLSSCLQNVAGFLPDRQIVIGYEPIWAIGPGKIPPGKEYISFVSRYIKNAVKDLYGFEPPVVYGGGLKEENAAMIGSIESTDGGLVALTRFSGKIGFEPEGLKRIIHEYVGSSTC